LHYFRYRLLFPDEDDISVFKKNFAILVARSWTRHVSWLKEFEPSMPKCIPHPHMNDTRKKTKKVIVIYVLQFNLSMKNN